MSFAVGNRWGKIGGALRAERAHTNKMVTRALTEMLQTTDPKQQRKRADALAYAMYHAAVYRYNVFAAKFIAERVEGLPKQEVAIETTGNVKRINVNMDIGELADIYSQTLRGYTDAQVIDSTPVPAIPAPAQNEQAAAIRQAVNSANGSAPKRDVERIRRDPTR